MHVYVIVSQSVLCMHELGSTDLQPPRFYVRQYPGILRPFLHHPGNSYLTESLNNNHA